MCTRSNQKRKHYKRVLTKKPNTIHKKPLSKKLEREAPTSL
ncbi:hypothetical protein MtrunA17_Chr1g0185011 [Medicago truncatula]|uniref:Uncharacterized protein n=1 Tax=Medicago truncatula TaxID=3880 RepID=A0A396JPC3_MEDTR|nr:hypothetical protein MtrunA17_Chr1g0185011 [Medicago truncatula]